MEPNSLLQRLEMYAMVNSIENDFVDGYLDQLEIEDIPKDLVEKSKASQNNKSCFETILRGLDLQGFIEIANANINKLGVKKSEKDFINNDFSRIIPIRNKVMHPRLFDFFDCPTLEACFEKVEEKISFINWKNVRDTKRMINENPSALLKYERNLRKSDKTIENLPVVVDFDDTSFIGRRKEIGEIKEKLYKKHVNILSIVGDGGVGKTAITIKLLYDLLDDENNPFELILWVSLKTNELNNYEFQQINNSIHNTSLMYDKLSEFIGGNENKSTQENLIELTKSFKTLLVLDNLETINTEEIKDFLDNFIENGKVIITSRIGLGEMEHRYFLLGLNDNDLMQYFNTLLELHGKESIYTNQEKTYYAKEQLHSNPLAIKWFVNGLAAGISATELLKNKHKLVNFCMSNVYEKLSTKAKELLVYLKGVGNEITFAEIAFIIGEDSFVESDVRDAINKLIKSNFVQQEKFQFHETLAITDFARDFIKTNVIDDEKLSGIIKQKLKTLNAFDQGMIEKRKNSPYSLQTFHYSYGERKKIVASYYLDRAVTCNYKGEVDKALEYIALAKILCPKYFECNKIEAYIMKSIDPQRAKEEYEIARQNTTTDEDQRLIFINYKEFCMSNNDFQGALSSLESAMLIRNELALQFEKVKLLAYISEFEKAEKLLDEIELMARKDIKNENIFFTRKADIIRRKAELIAKKDYSKRFELLKEGVLVLNLAQEMDKQSLDYLALILSDMMFMYFDVEVVRFVYETIKNADKEILKTKSMKLLKHNVKPIKDKIPAFENREEFLSFLISYNDVIDELNENEAIVYHIKDHFGFIKNKIYYKGIHFVLSKIKYNVMLGDIVEFEEVYETRQGYYVNNFKLVRRTQ